MKIKLISCLGTGDYKECRYEYLGKCSELTCYVQEALVALLDLAEGKDTELILLVTDEAKERHLPSLIQRCAEKFPALKLSVRQIPRLHSAPEMWDFFDILSTAIEPNDRVMLDITHAFRSLPMLALVGLNFAKVIKQIELKGIYYGCFEALGFPAQMAGSRLEQGNVPIIDLSSFDILLNWTYAVDKFVTSGDASSVCELNDKKLKLAARDGDEQAREMRGFAIAARSFSQAATVCRLKELSGYAAKVVEKSQMTNERPEYSPFRQLMEHAQDQFREFSGNPHTDGVAAAAWCREHGLIQQAYTILEETLISLALDCAGISDVNNRKLRGRVVYAANAATKNGKLETDDKSQDEKEALFKLSLLFEQKREIALLLEQLALKRNDINHGGMNDQATDFHAFVSKLSDLCERAKAIARTVGRVN